MNQKKSYWYILVLILLVKIALQYLIVSPEYDLQRDEYLHLDQANHLSWGYPSVPPFSSWIALLIKSLGNTVFWIRFFPALAGAITIWIVWETVKLLNGSLYALLLSSLSILFSGLARLNVLFQPNSVDVLFYTLIFYFIIAFIKTEKTKHLYFLGMAIGFGMLNKYNIIFLVIALGFALVLSPQRKILANKHFWFALGLSFIIFLPNFLWQINHQFPVIYHMNELKKTQLVNVNRFDFLEEQLKFFIGSCFVWISAIPTIILYKPFKSYRIIALTYLFTICLFVYFQAKGYYAFGLYPILFAFGSIFIDNLLKRKYLIWLKPTLILANITLFILIVPIVFPFKSPNELVKNAKNLKKLGLLRWEDGKDHHLPQDFADMLGWKEMAKKTDLAFDQIPQKEKAYTLVLADNYGQTGAINYYSSNIKNAVSYTFDYISWFPKLKNVKHIIVIGEKSDDEDIVNFKRFKKIGEVENKFAREYGTGIYLLSYPNQIIINKLQLRLNDLILLQQ